MSDRKTLVLGQHIDLLSGFPFSSAQFSQEDGVPLIRIRDVTHNSQPDVFYTGDYANTYLVENGDILIGMDGDFRIVRWSGGAGVLNQRVMKISEREGSLLDLDFVFYWLTVFLPKLNAITAATTVKHLSVKDITTALVDAPPKNLQKKIVTVLNTLDYQISTTQELIDKYTDIKQGMIIDLFSRGIDPATGKLRPSLQDAPERYHKTSIGWLPKEWGVVELQDISSVERGKFTHRPRDDQKCYGGRYPFIQTGDVTACEGGVLSKYKQTLSDFGRSVSKSFPAGTIAVTIAANIADTAILNSEMCFPDSVVGVIVNNDAACSRFVELCIRMNKGMLDARAPQSAQKNINLEDLRPLLVPFPSITEQVMIGARYDSLADYISSLKLEQQKLQVQKAGLMRDLLTGKVPVSA